MARQRTGSGRVGVAVAMLGALAACAVGQDIDLSGRVVDPSNAGLPGATVRLLGQGLSTVTDSSGAFRIVRLAAVRPDLPARPWLSPRISSGRLIFDVPRDGERVTVETFDIAGRRRALPLDASLRPGRYSVALDSESRVAGYGFVRIALGEQEWTLRWVGRSGVAGPGGGEACVPNSEAAPGTAKPAIVVDTLDVLREGYSYKRILINGFQQYIAVVLEPQSDLVFTINRGAVFTMKDTCELTLLDRFRSLVAVRFSDTAASGVPLFDTGTARNPVWSYPVSDTLTHAVWVLPKGPGRKTVWAQLTRVNGQVDTVRDQIDPRPYRVDITMRPGHAGAWPPVGMRRVSCALRRDSVLAYVFSPRHDMAFSVNIHGDSSFAPEFRYCLAFSAADKPKVLSDTLLRTEWVSGSLSGVGPDHDTAAVYRYRYSLETPEGRVNLGRLYRQLGRAGYYLYRDGPAESNWAVVTTLSWDDRYFAGLKEVALMLEFRGQYFGDERTVVVSAQVNLDVDFVTVFDAYPPAVKRDRWEYEYASDGDTVRGAFSIRLSTGSPACDSGLLSTRGYVSDAAGAGVNAVELVCALMPDSLAAVWVRGVTWKRITLAALLSLPHYRFPFAVTPGSALVCPVSWSGINTAAWPDGWYLIALVTTDGFGNTGIAPFSATSEPHPDDPASSNPQHWRIVTDNHVYE